MTKREAPWWHSPRKESTCRRSPNRDNRFPLAATTSGYRKTVQAEAGRGQGTVSRSSTGEQRGLDRSFDKCNSTIIGPTTVHCRRRLHRYSLNVPPLRKFRHKKVQRVGNGTALGGGGGLIPFMTRNDFQGRNDKSTV